MAEIHERTAALIRKYGTDPAGVERAMLEAGHGAITAKASAHMYAGFLEKSGYNVSRPAPKPKPVPEPAPKPEPEPVKVKTEAPAKPAPKTKTRAKPKRARATNRGKKT